MYVDGQSDFGGISRTFHFGDFLVAHADADRQFSAHSERLVLPDPEVGKPLFALEHGKRGVEREVIDVAVRQAVVEEHRAPLAGVDRQPLRVIHPRLSGLVVVLVLE